MPAISNLPHSPFPSAVPIIPRSSVTADETSLQLPILKNLIWPEARETKLHLHRTEIQQCRTKVITEAALTHTLGVLPSACEPQPHNGQARERENLDGSCPKDLHPSCPQLPAVSMTLPGDAHTSWGMGWLPPPGPAATPLPWCRCN